MNCGSNAELVRHLIAQRLITTAEVEQLFFKVDRAIFVPKQFQHMAYHDRPLPLNEEVTISAPNVHGPALDTLLPTLFRFKSNPKNLPLRCLDVGSGSGYMLAMFAEITGPEGKLAGIEYIPEIAQLGIDNLKKIDKTKKMMDTGNLIIQHGDGHNGGYPPFAPYHIIHVGAAATEIPQALVDQLAPGGRMILPVGPQGGDQYIYIVDKDEKGEVRAQRTTPVRFVPLKKGGIKQLTN